MNSTDFFNRGEGGRALRFDVGGIAPVSRSCARAHSFLGKLEMPFHGSPSPLRWGFEDFSLSFKTPSGLVTASNGFI